MNVEKEKMSMEDKVEFWDEATDGDRILPRVKMIPPKPRTTSNVVKIRDIKGVERLIGEYWFDKAHPKITDGGLTIRGYSLFYCFRENNSERATNDFLERLSEYLEDGEQLIIQEIDVYRLEFPFFARETIVDSWGIKKDNDIVCG